MTALEGELKRVPLVTEATSGFLAEHPARHYSIATIVVVVSSELVL
jgi:hypothetical protein